MSNIINLIDAAAKKKKSWQTSKVLSTLPPPSSVPGAKKVKALDNSKNGKPSSGSDSTSTNTGNKSPWNETGRTVYDPYYVTDSSGMFFYVVNPIKSLNLQTSDTPAKTITINYTDTTPT